MSYFLCKAIPPRPTFVTDQNESERAVVGDHGRYWTERLHQGAVVVFGAVLDPGGVWGVAVVEADSADDVQRLIAEDPASRAGLFRYEVYPMPNAVARPGA